jgi:hypothetical protein
VVDPVLYLMMVVVAFLPAGALSVTPLQAGGMTTGLVFVTGLVGVWIALSEQAVADGAAPAGSSHGVPVRPAYRRDPAARRPQPTSR